MGEDQYMNDKFEGDLHFCKKWEICNRNLNGSFWFNGKQHEIPEVTGKQQDIVFVLFISIEEY